MYIYVRAFVHVSVCICMHTNVDTVLCLYVFMCVCMSVGAYEHVCMHAPTYVQQQKYNTI